MLKKDFVVLYRILRLSDAVIGTTSPVEKLNVNGAIRLENNEYTMTMYTAASCESGDTQLGANRGAVLCIRGTSPCTPGASEVFSTDSSYTDSCGHEYTQVSGCWLTNGNQVANSCIANSTSFRRNGPGSACGYGDYCNSDTGVIMGESTAGCGTCYNKFIR
jgi:hypothetical protein